MQSGAQHSTCCSQQQQQSSPTLNQHAIESNTEAISAATNGEASSTQLGANKGPTDPDAANASTTGVAHPAVGSNSDSFVSNVPLAFLCRTPAGGAGEHTSGLTGSSLTLSQIRELSAAPGAAALSSHSRTAALDSPWTWHDVCESARFQNMFPRNVPVLDGYEQDEFGGEGAMKQIKPARPRHRLHHTPRSKTHTNTQPSLLETGEQCFSRQAASSVDPPTGFTDQTVLSLGGQASGDALLTLQQGSVLPISQHGRRRKHQANASAAHLTSGSSVSSDTPNRHAVEQSHALSPTSDAVPQPISHGACQHSNTSLPQDGAGSSHTAPTSPRLPVATDDVLRSGSSTSSGTSADAMSSQDWISDPDCPAEREFYRLKERLDRATTRLANSLDQDNNSSSSLSISDMMESQADIDIISPSIGKGDVVFQFWRHVPFG